MKSQAVQYQVKTYGYIMSLLDVFANFIGCVLYRSSSGVKENIKKVFAVHGMPETLRSDNGKEFKGSVKRFCRMKKIRMVQSRPYSPRVQRKVE